MAEFPGFEEESVVEIEQPVEEIVEDLEGVDEGSTEEFKNINEQAINFEIANHINSAYKSLSKARELYLQRLRYRIRRDSKDIWSSQEFIDPAIDPSQRDSAELPEFHVLAKQKHMNDFSTKSFLDNHRKILEKLTSLLGFLG